jgi:antitoxin HicB
MSMNPKRIYTKETPLSEYSYTVLFEPLLEGGFQVIVPVLPEIVTYGRTLDEAREMARDAIRCVLESNLKAGEPIPEDRQPVTERVDLALP